MNTDAAYVIVGSSLAGAKAAETLREDGFGGPVVLIGERFLIGVLGEAAVTAPTQAMLDIAITSTRQPRSLLSALACPRRGTFWSKKP